MTVARIAERLTDLGITDLVVWGLKSGQHTHSYIHRAVYLAFRHIASHGNMKVHWYDDAPSFVPSRGLSLRRKAYLFFCSPHYGCDKHIPVLEDSYYIAHADTDYSYEPEKNRIVKYDGHIARGQAIFWRVFRGFPEPSEGYGPEDSQHLVFYNTRERRLIMPWATDLMPHEIDRNGAAIVARFKEGKLFQGNKVLFVGTIWQKNEDIMQRFEKSCLDHGLSLSIEKIDSVEDLVVATQSAHMAPAIQGEGHCVSESVFYVPCRIFKNASYGAVGVTNNLGVNNLFRNRLICKSDLNSLIEDYEQYVDAFDESKLAATLETMNEVRNQHTYLNRVWQCLTLMRR